MERNPTLGRVPVGPHNRMQKGTATAAITLQHTFRTAPQVMTENRFHKPLSGDSAWGIKVCQLKTTHIEDGPGQNDLSLAYALKAFPNRKTRDFL